MPRSRRVILVLSAAALAAAAILVGLPEPEPGRGRSGALPRGRVQPLHAYLERLGPCGAGEPAGHALTLELRRLLSGQSERGGALVDEALAALSRGQLEPFSVVQSCALLLEGDALPRGAVRPPAAGGPDLPLRAIGALGDRGIDLLRVSAENSACFPPDFRQALAMLIGALEALAAAAPPRAAADRRGAAAAEHWRGRLFAPAGAAAGLDEEEAALMQSFERATALCALADLTECVTVALPALQAAVRAPFLQKLRLLPDGAGVPRNLVLASECTAGLVLIGGLGTTVLPLRGTALAVDLGGDDRWCGGVPLAGLALPQEPSVRLIIDLDGRDRYEGGGFSCGAACDGVALLVDAAGDDVYEAAELEFGAAVFGAAALFDLAGRDQYRCARGGLGFGFMGLGILFDAENDDRYQCSCAGAGAGATGGAGILVDHWGDDLYLALPGSALADPGTAAALSLGAGWPLFSGLPGGLGLLLDRRGDDVYRAASSAAGFGAGSGVGLLLEGRGDDLYSCGEFALGAARDGGFGLLRDLEGNDEYLSRARSQGFGAAGAGLFIDDDGDDRCRAQAPCRGAGEAGGGGMFADIAPGS